MIDVQQKKSKIISFLEQNGPSLPVRIAKAIEMDPMFASAIMSELLNSKNIKTSYMKIGASPLYLLSGQEQKLEEHIENLKSVEKEAFLKIKEKKVLTDEEETPAIRVALRNIKDFAAPFKFKEKIMWKYTFATQEEVEKKLLSKEERPEPRIEVKKEEAPKSEEEEENSQTQENEETEEEKEEEAEEKEEEVLEEVPKAWEAKKEEIKEAKEKSKKIESIFDKKEEEENKEEPEFLIEVKDFLKKKSINFLEEIRTEKKEIVATVNITSQLGNINFLLIAKNKKTTTKDEIDAAIQMATRSKMPCLLIIRKQPSKAIQKNIDENHLIKLEIME